MRKVARALTALLLVGIALVSSGCNSGPDVQKKVEVCLGNIGLNVGVHMASDEEPLVVKDLLTFGPPCIEAMVEAFGPSTSTSASTPNVAITESSSEGVASGSVRSNTWSNCTPYNYQLRFDFYVPFAMIVGPQDARGTFSSPPSGNLDNDAVARALFDKYGSTIAGSTTSGPSQSVELVVRPYTQIVLTLPITQHYRYGAARLSHNGTTTYLPWFFTNGFEQTGRITYSAQSC